MRNITIIRLLILSIMLMASASHAQTCQWAHQSNGNNTDYSVSTVADATGNTYTTSTFDGAQLSIGSITLANPYPGIPSAYLAKFDPSGNVLWAKLLGGGDMNLTYCITMDGAGKLYVYGNFFDTTLVFGTTTLTNASAYDNFLVKLDTSGDPIWARAEHQSTLSGGYDFATATAADDSGHVIVAGSYDNSITIGSITLSASGGHGGVYVAKYDTAGNVLWAKTSDGAGYADMNAITLDGTGNIYIAGDFNSPTLTLGDSTISNIEGSDMFLAKYGPGGTALWVRGIADSSYSSINDIDADNAGNLYVVGLLNNPAITLGAYTLSNAAYAAGGGNAFIAQYNANGGVNWAQRGGGTTADGAFSVDISPLGYAVVGGAGTSTPSIIGDSTLAKPGFFLAGYNATGTVRWLKTASASNMGFPSSLSHDAAGNIYASGYFSGSLSINGHSLTDTSTIGNNEVFSVKFSGPVTAAPMVKELQQLSIYPNPATSQLIISTSGAAITDVVITDLLGQELRHLPDAGATLLHVDISSLPPGVYLARINGIDVRKFVKE